MDQSVYLLRDGNRLTKERIFKSSEELDLGYGAGGGKNNKDIFKNAGVVLMINNFVSDGREDYGCDKNSGSKKRRAEDDLVYKIYCEWVKRMLPGPVLSMLSA